LGGPLFSGEPLLSGFNRKEKINVTFGEPLFSEGPLLSEFYGISNCEPQKFHSPCMCDIRYQVNFSFRLSGNDKSCNCARAVRSTPVDYKFMFDSVALCSCCNKCFSNRKLTNGKQEKACEKRTFPTSEVDNVKSITEKKIEKPLILFA